MSGPEMNNYRIHTSGGETLDIEAHHYVINEHRGRLELYKSETEENDMWVIFLRGVDAIETRSPKAEWKTY